MLESYSRTNSITPNNSVESIIIDHYCYSINRMSLFIIFHAMLHEASHSNNHQKRSTQIGRFWYEYCDFNGNCTAAFLLQRMKNSHFLVLSLSVSSRVADCVFCHCLHEDLAVTGSKQIIHVQTLRLFEWFKSKQPHI